MNIIEQLNPLSEDDLRKKVIIPLLHGLGCSEIVDNCGPAEYGKDIIYRANHFLMKDVYGAVVLKKTSINKTSLGQIHIQITDAITSMRVPCQPTNTVQIHEILVITSRKITSEAAKYISEQSGKCFQNIHFIDGVRLEFLINQVIQRDKKRKRSSYIFGVETFGVFVGYHTEVKAPIMFNHHDGQVIRGSNE